MLIIKDIFDEEVKLTKAVWDDILLKHPEVERFRSKLILTISAPEIITKSKYDQRVILYYRFFEEIFQGKYLVAVIKEVKKDEKYVSTAYITDRRKGGEVIWLAK